jgi:hypothetical protein
MAHPELWSQRVADFMHELEAAATRSQSYMCSCTALTEHS